MIKTVYFVIVSILAKGLETISGVTLLAVVVLTIVDIVGRYFGKPVMGTYEIVSAAGGLVISCAMPVSVLQKKHVIIDLVLERLSIRSRMALHIASRLISMTLFIVLGWAFLMMGHDVQSVREVSSVLQFPLHPLVYAMGGAFLGVCLALIDDLCNFGRLREAHDE